MEIVVEADAIDELDHVNNATYLQYVELAARRHSEALGLTTASFLEAGGLFVVRRHEVTYFAPAHLGDRLELRTAVEGISGPRCTRVVEIWRGDQRIAEAHTQWVWIDPTARVPKRIPSSISQAFAGSGLPGE
jgi:acyl-CoA thioester hydrolase